MEDSPHQIEQLVAGGVRDKVHLGAVWAVGDATGPKAAGTAGVLDPAEPDIPMRPDTIFDVASLTEILAVWSTTGALWEDGALPLDEPLGTFWPEVTSHPLGQVTARQLLTHTAGVPLRAQLKNLYGIDPATIRAGVLHEALHRPPGEAVEYTDRAALILGYLAEKLSGQSLDELAHNRVWQPLGMTRTHFGPLAPELTVRCAPTELDEDTGRHLKGTAHDFSARLPDGVCGIAGTFSILDDLARFLQYMLDPMTAPTAPGFGPSWVEEPSTPKPEPWSPCAASSGTPPPPPTPPTAPTCTTASLAPACGSPLNGEPGPSC